MKLAKRKIKWLTRLVLVTMLFAQGILAAHACVTHEVSAVKALNMQMGSDVAPCHQAEKTSANECLMHCVQSEQINLDQQQVAAPIINTVVLRIAVPAPQRIMLTALPTPVAFNNGPPLTIRYCSFLI